MATSSTEYEMFVAKLISDIQGCHRSISHLGNGQKNKIKGISGVHHQVDVSFIDHDFKYPTLVLIECKRLERPIELEHVKVLQATRDDILRNLKEASSIKAIIITTIGSQKGAIKYADYYKIDVEQLPHDKNFTFKYENIISIGKVIPLQISIDANATLVKMCEKCGYTFVIYDDENSICPNCSYAGMG